MNNSGGGAIHNPFGNVFNAAGAATSTSEN